MTKNAALLLALAGTLMACQTSPASVASAECKADKSPQCDADYVRDVRNVRQDIQKIRQNRTNRN